MGSTSILAELLENSNLVDQNSEHTQPLPSPKVYILKILIKNLPDVNVKSDNCEEYFNLITYLIKIC